MEEAKADSAELRYRNLTIVRRTCQHCGMDAEVLVPTVQLDRWRAGMHVQKAFPDLDADQREILISGTHPDCWNEMFGSDD